MTKIITHTTIAGQIPGVIEEAMLPVTKQETQHAVANISIPQNQAVTFTNINWTLSDPIDIRSLNYGVEPVEKTKQTLPAIIHKGVRTTQQVTPNWHLIRNLPGYMASAIRAIGRQVFSMYTDTPIEEIQVIACIGNGPNEIRELNAVAGYLQQHGQRDPEMEIDFNQSIEGYKAKAIVYDANGFTFVLVNDFAGSYIYSWPNQLLLT